MKPRWQKDFHEMGIQTRTCMWYSPKYFVDPEDASECAKFRDPEMERSKQNGVGIFVLMK